jgi:hypothetical protein
MDKMFPAFGLTPDEKRKALSTDPYALVALRDAGVRSRPVWREVWIGDARKIELSTRRHLFLVIAPEDLMSLTETEIADRIRRKLSEGSTLEFPCVD